MKWFLIALLLVFSAPCPAQNISEPLHAKCDDEAYTAKRLKVEKALELKLYPEAESLLYEMDKGCSEKWRLWRNLAGVAARKSDAYAVKAYTEKAILEAPAPTIDDYALLALAHGSLGNVAETGHFLQKAHELDPNDTRINELLKEYQNWLTKAQKEQGRVKGRAVLGSIFRGLAAGAAGYGQAMQQQAQINQLKRQNCTTQFIGGTAYTNCW